MRMRLISVNSNMSIDDTSDTKNHSLSFRPVTLPGMPGAGGSMLGSSVLSLLLTRTEANTYTLGAMYNVTATLADNQQPMEGEVGVDVPL